MYKINILNILYLIEAICILVLACMIGAWQPFLGVLFVLATIVVGINAAMGDIIDDELRFLIGFGGIIGALAIVITYVVTITGGKL